ncbi:C2H2-type zinc finger protein [Haladaptatus sp. T7]|nr:C2H2-type zinc finger protein [Haladaptatus sp. T7]
MPDNPTASDHECQFCHESFDSEDDLREHIHQHHSTA